MTLTEIEDSIIENSLRSTEGKNGVDGEAVAAYLNFLQAVEIRRRLVGEAEKKAARKAMPVYVFPDSAPWNDYKANIVFDSTP